MSSAPNHHKERGETLWLVRCRETLTLGSGSVLLPAFHQAGGSGSGSNSKAAFAG